MLRLLSLVLLTVVSGIPDGFGIDDDYSIGIEDDESQTISVMLEEEHPHLERPSNRRQMCSFMNGCFGHCCDSCCGFGNRCDCYKLPPPPPPSPPPSSPSPSPSPPPPPSSIGVVVGIAAGLVTVIVIVVIVIVVSYLRKQRARPELPAGAVELSSTVDAPISLHNVSAVPMDMRPNDAALAAAAADVH